MVHRFLHLSDIHFGQEKKDGPIIKHDHIRGALIKDVAEFAKRRGKADRILVTGDIAYRGSPDEYKTATEWLDGLAKACGCREDHVSTIPGNHDCDRTAIKNQPRIICANLRASDSPELLQRQLHQILEDGESANPFLPKLQAYRKFANGFGCDFESSSCPRWIRYIDLPRGIKLKLHGLTSVQISDGDDAPGRMVLGSQQYTIAQEHNTINIVLLHHPLEWFMDKVEAKQFLQANARVIMVGHEHDMNIQHTKDMLSGAECLMLHAGAVTPPDLSYSYTYNWLEISHVEKDLQQYLSIEIFPRVWVQQSVRFEADRTRMGGAAESRVVDIHCPNLLPEPAGEQAPAIRNEDVRAKELGSLSTESPLTIEITIKSVQQGGSMSNPSADFDRLRYIFWRYLDWRQRVKVLVEVDALPETADQPVPQTMERIALENLAKDAAKLHALWEAIMPLLPEEKREENPFPKGV